MNDAQTRQLTAVENYRKLHESGCFVLPNPWNIGTAIYLQKLGFRALASTSAGFAFSRGLADENVPRDLMLEHLREIAGATPLPLNADFQAGYAETAEGVAANVKLCLATGVAGLSIEDNSGRADAPLFEKKIALDRLRAARAAIDDSGIPVVLTGRCEAWLVGEAEPFGVALDRLVAYAEAGADCLYAPGVDTPEEISALVKAVAPKPLNILVAGFNHTLSLAQLTDLGVRRVSVGSALASMAWGAFGRAAREMAATGTFASFAEGAPFSEINGLFAQQP